MTKKEEFYQFAVVMDAYGTDLYYSNVVKKEEDFLNKLIRIGDKRSASFYAALSENQFALKCLYGYDPAIKYELGIYQDLTANTVLIVTSKNKDSIDTFIRNCSFNGGFPLVTPGTLTKLGI